MSLAEVTAVDVDSSSSSSFLSLFVHCRRTTTSLPTSIYIQLVDPPRLYEADVASSYKPRALDCSGAEYVTAVESALVASLRDQPCRFEFQWSKVKQSLTLMERAEFAMKFCEIKFRVLENVAKWRDLLHQIATHERDNVKQLAEKQSKIEHCKVLLGQNETLLESALTAKQKVEDELFLSFCAVLNAKKDEIRKLQLEIEKAQDMHQKEINPTKKWTSAVPKRMKKVTGAKLMRQTEEEEEENEKMSDKSKLGNAMGSNEDKGNGKEQKCAKNDAIDAYNALVPKLRSNSVQISSAKDLIMSMDEVIKNGEDETEATQRDGENPNRIMVFQPVATNSHIHGVELLTPRTRNATALKVKTTPAPELESKKSLRPTSQADEAMDPEEKDILDMLS